MPAYIPITEAETDPGAPGTSQLWKKWRDNPIAMFEGEVGAPRLSQGAIDRPLPGTQIRFRDDLEERRNTTVNVPVRVKSYGCSQVGTVRVAYEHGTLLANAGFTQVRRLRNNVSTVLSEFPNTSVAVARTLDVSILPGDDISVWIASSGGTEGFIRNFRIQTAGQNLWVFGSEQRVEGNVYFGV